MPRAKMRFALSIAGIPVLSAVVWSACTSEAPTPSVVTPIVGDSVVGASGHYTDPSESIDAAAAAAWLERANAQLEEAVAMGMPPETVRAFRKRARNIVANWGQSSKEYRLDDLLRMAQEKADEAFFIVYGDRASDEEFEEFRTRVRSDLDALRKRAIANGISAEEQ